MAPALTKFLKDGHGIHLASPPASNEHSVYSMDLDSQLRPSEDFQNMMFSVFPSFDLTHIQPNTLDLPSDPRVTTGQSESLTHPSPHCLALSYNNSISESQLTSMFHTVSDMSVLPEHNGKEGCSKSACQCLPGASDIPPLHRLSSVSSFAIADYNSVLTPTIISNQENCRLDQLVPGLQLQNQIKKRASRQTDLQSRSQKLRRRLQALLGQHASLHCNQQLEGLQRPGLHLGRFSAGAGLSQAEREQHFTWPETSPLFTEIKEFGQCGRAVLRGLQEALDSEATASSSSDDEPVQTKTPGEYRAPNVAPPCFEKQWLKERAKLGSRWTWLQLRVSELEGRVQQLTKLHKNICSTKGCVVLADSQPMTERQMKNALLREMAGFSGTALDTDNEPCSPTRLLHNIERQSAQLSKIVNSLIPPLNLSPISKPLQPWENTKIFNSDVFVSGSSKKKNFSIKRRQLFKDDMSCVCARTRPLVTYHKPRLFRLSSICNNYSSKCSSPLSGFTSCSCSFCSSSCDPVLFSDMSSSNDTGSSRTCSSNSADSSVLSRFTKGSAREEWSQIPLVINALPLSPVHYRRRSSTPLYSSHKHRQDYKKRVLGLSPIRQHDCLQRKDRRVHQKKKKRRRRDSVTEDDEGDSYGEDSSDEMFEENYVLVSQKQSTRGAVHRRHGESVFNIDNVIIPASLTKVEKLQYKDILTPSWQEVFIQALMKNEADSEKSKDEQIEILTDEAFAQRHLPLEQKEKLRWSFWGKRRCRHSSRSGCRLASCDSVLEENSVDWSLTQLDTDEQLSTEECLPQAPWERRVFPLNEDDEQALSSEVLQWCSTCTLSSSTSLNSDLIASHSTDALLPSYGHYMDCTISEH